ncbi:hypothetical protein AV530_003585 [Patagioenas fasciata monilis]|uniref:Uncharacterized protein n=1 Tax=Patagioenas fasciata monilis TaxID=372326 RepID=A0A1V4KYJ9_PATFA|nr:hypothetical protein AV530_003585 [Patagioenas fasciata monilis]
MGDLSSAGDHKDLPKASGITSRSINPVYRGQGPWLLAGPGSTAVPQAGWLSLRPKAASLGEQVAPRVSVSPVDQRDLLSEVSIWHFQQFLTVVF